MVEVVEVLGLGVGDCVVEDGVGGFGDLLATGGDLGVEIVGWGGFGDLGDGVGGDAP